MVTVQFTGHLKRYFPNLDKEQVEGTKVSDLLVSLEKKYPGLSGYIVDERGALRQHVNIYIEDTPVSDRVTLSDEVSSGTQVFVLQALSGG